VQDKNSSAAVFVEGGRGVSPSDGLIQRRDAAATSVSRRIFVLHPHVTLFEIVALRAFSEGKRPSAVMLQFLRLGGSVVGGFAAR